MARYFWSLSNFPNFITQKCFAKAVVKTVITIIFFIKSPQNKEKELALTSFNYINREIWFDDSKKLTSSHTRENSKMLHLT